MKYIQLKLADDLHRKIKVQAAMAEKTIPEYVLHCVNKEEMCEHHGFSQSCSFCIYNTNQ